MSLFEPIFMTSKLSANHFSKHEAQLLEADMLNLIYDELVNQFRKKYKPYFYLLKYNIEEEVDMLEANLSRLILMDIVASNDYDLDGIALYTNTHKDIVEDVYQGRNTNPSVQFFRALIAIHKTIRRDLYESIMNKFVTQVA